MPGGGAVRSGASTGREPSDSVGITPRIYRSYDEVLEDPDVDAVELLTPTSLHAEQCFVARDAIITRGIKQGAAFSRRRV